MTKQIGDGFGEVLESVKAKRTSESGQDDMQGYVTLYQAAKIVCRSKRTLEKIKDLPLPNVEGGGGKTAFWAWDEMRPWLELHFGMKLPKKFPKHIPPRPPVLSADSDDDPGEPAEEPAVTKGKPKSPPKPDWETGHYQCKSPTCPRAGGWTQNGIRRPAFASNAGKRNSAERFLPPTRRAWKSDTIELFRCPAVQVTGSA